MPNNNIDVVLDWLHSNPDFKVILWVDARTYPDGEMELKKHYYQKFEQQYRQRYPGAQLDMNRIECFDVEAMDVSNVFVRYEIDKLRPNYGASSDWLRYLILFKFGGVYADSDVLPAGCGLCFMTTPPTPGNLPEGYNDTYVLVQPSIDVMPTALYFVERFNCTPTLTACSFLDDTTPSSLLQILFSDATARKNMNIPYLTQPQLHTISDTTGLPQPTHRALTSSHLFDTELDDHRLVLNPNSQRTGFIGNDFLISTPENPLMNAIIQRAMSNYQRLLYRMTRVDTRANDALCMGYFDSPGSMTYRHDELGFDGFISLQTQAMTGPGCVRGVLCTENAELALQYHHQVLLLDNLCTIDGITSNDTSWVDKPILEHGPEAAFEKALSALTFEVNYMGLLRLEDHVLNIACALNPDDPGNIENIAQEFIAALEQSELIEYHQIQAAQLTFRLPLVKTFYEQHHIPSHATFLVPCLSQDHLSSVAHHELAILNLNNALNASIFHHETSPLFLQATPHSVKKLLKWLEEQYIPLHTPQHQSWHQKNHFNCYVQEILTLFIQDKDKLIQAGLLATTDCMRVQNSFGRLLHDIPKQEPCSELDTNLDETRTSEDSSDESACCCWRK